MKLNLSMLVLEAWSFDPGLRASLTALAKDNFKLMHPNLSNVWTQMISPHRVAGLHSLFLRSVHTEAFKFKSLRNY